MGSEILVEEMLRYTQLLKSETAATLLAALLAKMEVVKVLEKFRRICKAYVATPEKADILHAAACLQTGAILISNDRHFNRIRDEGIIEVWNVVEAIRKLLH